MALSFVATIARRLLSRANGLLALFGVLAVLGGSAEVAAKAAPRQDLFYIGSQGTEIKAARLDPANGAMIMIGPVAQTDRPTWTLRHPTLPILYVANSAGNDGKRDGTVIAYRVDSASGGLTKISEVSAGGGGTTNLWLDRPSMTLIAANYGGGSVSAIPVQRDGTLGELVSVVRTSGSGPHPRQAVPHAHGVTVDPTGKFVLAADLGADRVFVFPFNRQTRRLGDVATDPSRYFTFPPGSGPRHLLFGPTGRALYVVTELSAEISVLAWDAKAGRLTEVQKLSTDVPGFTGTRSAAELAFSSNGRFLYVTNRSDGAVLVYSVDRGTGRLTQIQRIRTSGQAPWAMALHRSGRWLVIPDGRADRIDVFAVDPRTGLLTSTSTSNSLMTPKPVSITFDR